MAMSDESALFAAEKAAVLTAALPRLAITGWQESVLVAACLEAGLDGDMRSLVFPEGVKSLLLVFFAAQDTAMLAALAKHGGEMGRAPDAMKIRERIYEGVAARVAVDNGERAVVRAAMAWLALADKGVAAQLLFQTAHVLWRWAGDSATDYNYYSKRLILSGVIASTMTFWLNDESPDSADSLSFLRRRIDNVMQFEKRKAQARQFYEKFSGSSAA